MIAFRSQAWWEMLSCAGVLAAFASCSGVGTQSEPVDTDEPGSVSGELAVYVADYEDGTSETSYFLRDAVGNERRLMFQQEPDVAPGAKIKVWGNAGTEAIDVRTFKPVINIAPAEGIGSQSSALVGQPARTPRVLCSVLVQNGGTPTVTIPQIEAAWHTGPKSDSNYLFENSYGRDTLTGKSYGPLPFSMGSGCDYSGLAKALRPMIPQADGCQHYAWVMSPNAGGCGWAGLGSVGTSDKPQQDTWYNNTTGCVAAVQEVMHNWGSLHSSSITCSGATAAQGGISDTLAGCTHSEYGDKFDTLGGGCRHMNAWQKLYQKVWGGCNAVKVSSSGTFNLYPTEVPCNGVQALQIPFPGGKTRSWQGSTLTSWYLEYRTSVGQFDTGMQPQVLAHLGIAPVLANQMNPKGSRVWIANVSGTAANPGLVAGKSFSDPAGGLTVTVASMDATKAVVTVDYPGGSGSPTCLDGLSTPFQAPGPEDCTTIPQPPDGGFVGAGGTGGTGGTVGAGGAKVDAGRGGAGGTGDAGGAGGGTGGQAGVGQAGGGQAGTGQAGTGQAGSGLAGAGGSGLAGSAGSGTTTGHPPPGDVNGGCACRMEASNTQRSPSLGGLLALGLGGFFVSRRRSRRRVG